MIVQNQRILIVYASQHHSTGGIANAVEKVLCENGTYVETKEIKDVTDLNRYDAVIIGGPIQFDKWVPATREFITMHQDILTRLPVAFFFSCMALSQQTEKSRRQGQKYADNLRNTFPKINPLAIGQFAGVLNLTKMPLYLRLVFRVIMTVTGVKEGDYRDWNAIRSWANDINSHLLSAKGYQ
jgi:menaquinone-dependent protoporphyrinogen oxidase